LHRKGTPATRWVTGNGGAQGVLEVGMLELEPQLQELGRNHPPPLVTI
jgi:hypothetical protein